MRFNHLVLEGQFRTYLADLNEQAQNRLQLIIRQMQEAESVNGTGFISEDEKGFDFSVTLGDDFKIVKDKERQKEIVEIKLQGT